MSNDHPMKTRNQLRRAHKLVAVIDGLADTTDVQRLDFARTLTPEKWADVAFLAGISAPSTTTAGMVVAILAARLDAPADPFAAFATAR